MTVWQGVNYYLPRRISTDIGWLISESTAPAAGATRKATGVIKVTGLSFDPGDPSSHGSFLGRAEVSDRFPDANLCYQEAHDWRKEKAGSPLLAQL